ncbi:MAG TPA: DUF1501 domain-containing protein [Pirellulales bacterium]|jgi:uncharacterized protein (DUF1501 family)|nr:DUF1501 domain-containing protein [Pirellulales bacterium]
MLRIYGESTSRYCDRLSRRNFLEIGVAGMASLGLADVLRSKASAVESGHPAGNAASRDTSVILIWLDGGPSHMDTYDMKPAAPAEYRGLWRPIPTNVAGIEISEMLPLQAKLADKFSIIRSLHHDNGDHYTAAHWMLTGHDGPNGSDTGGRNPYIGAIATRSVGSRRPGIPANVALPMAMSIGLRPGYMGGSFLGSEFDPFESGGDPNANGFQVQNLAPTQGLSIERLSDRRTLLGDLDQLRRVIDRSGSLEAMDKFQQRAYDLVLGQQAAKVFDLSTEDAKLRDRYGRNTWGQSTLLARRLVEAGSTFVTVHTGGWDHHWNLQSSLDSFLPRIDQMVSALFEDLHQRGLNEKVLVVMCGEFGRTPKMNDGGNGGAPMSMGTPGRDHWGNAMCCLLGGGGVRGGQVVGSSDARGEQPKDRPLTPGDLHATIFHVLGVDPQTLLVDRSNRPTPAIARGDVIRELV